jgi:hypothetical protein
MISDEYWHLKKRKLGNNFSKVGPSVFLAFFIIFNCLHQSFFD